MKSSGERSRTNAPSFSRTTASTSTRSVPARKVGGGCCADATIADAMTNAVATARIVLLNRNLRDHELILLLVFVLEPGEALAVRRPRRQHGGLRTGELLALTACIHH